jgi:hypothetical protein
MQWCVEVPSSSSPSLSLSSFPNNYRLSSIIISMSFILHFTHLRASVHSLAVSTCSPYLMSTAVDVHTQHEYVRPCPVSSPCQCLCEKESKRLWIDCFHRQLKSFPNFQSTPSNETTIVWNVDLAFNLFDTTAGNNRTAWLPKHMHVRHLVLSGSLVYDLIVQLNLTHRHLIDHWPSRTHFDIVDDRLQSMMIDNEQSDDEVRRERTNERTNERKQQSTCTLFERLGHGNVRRIETNTTFAEIIVERTFASSQRLEQSSTRTNKSIEQLYIAVGDGSFVTIESLSRS